MSKITNYSIRINGGPEGSVNYHRAEAFLFDESGAVIGLIQFYDEGQELPPSRNENNCIEFALPVSMLQNVTDLLRNEDPVFVHWQQSIRCGFLTTGMEPAGEGERN